MLAQLKAFWQRSQLAAVALIKSIVGAAIVGAPTVAGAVKNDPDIREHLHNALPPQWFGWAMLVSAVIVILAAPHGDGK